MDSSLSERFILEWFIIEWHPWLREWKVGTKLNWGGVYFLRRRSPIVLEMIIDPLSLSVIVASKVSFQGSFWMFGRWHFHSSTHPSSCSLFVKCSSIMAPPYRNEKFASGSGHRPFPSRNDRDGRMYDDRERSRSPGKHLPARQWCIRLYTPSSQDQFLQLMELWLTWLSFESMNKDRARSPRRLAADSRLEYSRDRESGQGYRSHDRDDYRRRNSRSSPHRGRHAYKDRDREGYRSASGNPSRSRSPRRGQPHMGQVSREVMMDGLPADMAEEHVSYQHWHLNICIIEYKCWQCPHLFMNRLQPNSEMLITPTA